MATYLIIGASSGIGKHLALLLAERGDTVIGTCHTTTEAIDHPRIHLQPLDVRSADATLTSLLESLAGVVYCPGTIDPKIRVNCIAPSLTDTPLSAQLLNTEQKRETSDQRHPMKRVGTTADVASMVEYLLSDAASWITGQVFHVDGGMSTLRT